MIRLLELDINYLDCVHEQDARASMGLGQQRTDEAFEIFGDRIKSIKATWKYDSSYPNGESLGHKQFWSEMDASFDKEKAVKSTTFYETMAKKGFSKIKLIVDDANETIIILINNK